MEEDDLFEDDFTTGMYDSGDWPTVNDELEEDKNKLEVENQRLKEELEKFREENQNLRMAMTKYLQFDEEQDSNRILKKVSLCPAVSPERRMSYVEIQMDWALYDKIKALFP